MAQPTRRRTTRRPKAQPDPDASTTAAEEPDRLARYRAKRHRDRTPEPAGDTTPAPSPEGPRFVIQKHAARRLHYDFRLEVDGVLRSWAVPRGPSPDPSQKRLAVAVEDHPLEYGDFEGVIPKGEYGGGEVIVWDTGHYRHLTSRNGAEVPIRQALEDGHIVFELDGHKLHGRYALTRTGQDGRQEQWILVKTRGDASRNPGDPVVEQPASVLSGRTLEDVRAESDPDVWDPAKGRQPTS